MIAIIVAMAFGRTNDKIFLPELTSDSYCVVDHTDFLKTLHQDKLVIYLNFDRQESREDFFSWVELSDKIANNLSIKTIFYIHLSDCSTKNLDFLKRFSMINDNHNILIDKRKEFLSVNGLGDLGTFSALLDRSNNSLYASKKDFHAGIKEKYEARVTKLLQVDLPFVDTWPDPTVK